MKSHWWYISANMCKVYCLHAQYLFSAVRCRHLSCISSHLLLTHGATFSGWTLETWLCFFNITSQAICYCWNRALGTTLIFSVFDTSGQTVSVTESTDGSSCEREQKWYDCLFCVFSRMGLAASDVAHRSYSLKLFLFFSVNDYKVSIPSVFVLKTSYREGNIIARLWYLIQLAC